MKSTFFEQSLEYKVEIDGETWNQGAMIKGELLVRNMTNETVKIDSVKIVIAYGLKKSIKEKIESIWDVLENLTLFENVSLAPNKEKTSNWSYNLKTDCPITDKMGGLFLLFGGKNVLNRGGRLDLNIKLHPILKNFLQTFTTQYRFLEKTQKRKNDWVEVKLIPPESREFPNLEYVTCLIRIYKNNLEVHYQFKVKTLGRSGEKIKVRNKIREVIQIISKEKYLQPGGFPNRTCFREKIDEALNNVRPEVIF